MSIDHQTVAVLGASANPERYANRAVRALLAAGHRVIPVTPAHGAIEGLEPVASVADIAEPVDTLTLYVGPDRLRGMIDAIAALRPGRVIFNPGTECPELAARLDAEGIRHQDACTLVLLSTGQFAA
ncbi:MAG: CoA-binding protein [Verrucomicrobiales bacterium]